MNLTGKNVVISGASGVIGAATAEAFARSGCRVVLGSHSRPELAEKLRNQLMADGLTAHHIQGDVGTADGAKEFMGEASSRLGGIDVFMNCVGVTSGGGEFKDLREDDWISAIRANLLTAVFPAQEAVRLMRKQNGGRIINISSVRGVEHCGRTSIMAYSAAKAALVNFTKTLAKEVAPTILVNGIAPGFVKTPNYDSMSEELKRSFLEATLLGQWIPASEIAETALFLSRSNSITGQILLVDGGFSLKFQ
jgi:3-oxoacyl-[acyl-carrier protein] reductase